MAGVERCRGGLAGFGGVGLAWQDSEGDGRRRKESTGVWGASAGVARIPKGVNRCQGASTGVGSRWQASARVEGGGSIGRGCQDTERGQQVSRCVGRFRGSSAGVGMSRGGISRRRVASAGGGHIGSDSLMLFAALIYCIFPTTGGKDIDGEKRGHVHRNSTIVHLCKLTRFFVAVFFFSSQPAH